MITIEKIKKHSKKHPSNPQGKICRFGDENITFSVVGGCNGLYGDFENTFEVAIFDTQTNKFITDLFYPESDGVIGYIGKEELVSLANRVLNKGFHFSPSY